MNDERLGELLMQRATGALSAPEAAALTQALAKLPPGEVARWERAAAELTAAFAAADSASREPLPAALADTLISTGEAIVRSQPRITPVTSIAVAPRRIGVTAWAGWLAAAAAVAMWIISPRTAPQSGNEPAIAQAVAPAMTVAQLRDSLISADSTSEQLDWTSTKDVAAIGASGDVVWNGRAQRGVMRIVGLQANDRRRWQYQLWIFDKTRDEKYPVDGGVFDIPDGQREVLVPIDARVPVGDAVMFAITVEPAGGVVVSARERIALLAQRKS